MRQKNLVIGLLVMLALVVSGFTYAFWASSIAVDGSSGVGNIQIGSGDTVTTDAVVTGPEAFTSNLVPEDYATDDDEYYVDLVFNIEWTNATINATINGDITGATGTIEVGAVTYSLLGRGESDPGYLTSLELSAMFNHNVETAVLYIDYGDTVQVTVRIIFEHEPADQATYEAIANATLVATIAFTIIPDAITPVTPNP